MKRKSFKIMLAAFACAIATVACLACGGSSASNSSSDTPVPSKTQVVAARRRATESSTQGYDFTLGITGDFSVLGLGASLSGKYAGAYRYDADDDIVAFKRTTSGALLPDSSLYVFTSGDSRIRLTMNGDKVKKLSVEIPEEQNLTMINLPIVSLVDSVKEANISEVQSQSGSYAYACPLKFDSTNAACSLINQVMEKLETGVSFKGITLSLNASKLYFNMADDKINDFRFAFEMKVDVKGVSVAVGFEYEQRASSTDIVVPSSAGILYGSSDISTNVTEINAALADLKNDPVYALHLTAVNEFDPGWNKLAVKDSYEAMMYKNTVDSAVWFNHSYCYKAHSEADGRESYKYTLGNVNGADAENQGTWLISRKGSNTQEKEDGVTADTQFDFLTAMVELNASEIDCLKKATDGAETRYTLYLNRAGTSELQTKIIGMINTNDYGDVIAVDNYFNTVNSVKEAEIEIELTDGKIAKIDCKTELCYTPTGGEYTEYNIVLNNTVELEVNKPSHIEKAAAYEPPTRVKGGVFGLGKNLNDSGYYIL
ncbi:MAG: hypothetical protein NC184_07655 [Roseburia sp.]|nr:hypothetical protein [Roseburia sp.]